MAAASIRARLLGLAEKISQRQHQPLKLCTKWSVFRMVLKDAVRLSGMEPDKPGLVQSRAQIKYKGT